MRTKLSQLGLLTGLDSRLQHRFDLRDRLPAVDRWHRAVRSVGYPGGKAGFVARAKELAAKYGDRFNPPASLQA
jgi:hypothetical protein